jgi:DNA polymerase-4
MRRILHIDMDAFFAAVEERRHPDLKGRPIVIGGRGDPDSRGVVSTASYAARKYGVHSGIPLRTAHKLCPEAVFLPVDYRSYARVSEEIKIILASVTPLMEDMGIDEAYLDLSAMNRSPETIAGEIKRRIREATGLSCSIGIAPNKLLAKIASDLQKPDGLTVLAEDDIPEKIWPLPVRKLRGVGPKTEAVLKRMGIHSIGDLAVASVERLTERFGPSHGRYLHRAARGIDESPIITHWEPKSMGRETTFQRDLSRWQDIARALAHLTRQVASSLKAAGYRARTVTVKVRFSDFDTQTRARTLDGPSDSPDLLRRAAFECLGRFELKKSIRLLGMRVSKLEKHAAHR